MNSNNVETFRPVSNRIYRLCNHRDIWMRSNKKETAQVSGFIGQQRNKQRNRERDKHTNTAANTDVIN